MASGAHVSNRLVIVHFHLFKNAGTSVERSLSQFFGERWASFDKNVAGARLDQIELEAYLRDHPQVAALSSHHVRPPLRNTGEFSFFPLVFLRHPLDRIRSAYDFERSQNSDSPSSRAASRLPFVDWIAFHDDRKSTQCQNFQTYALTSRRDDSGRPRPRHPVQVHLDSAIEFVTALPAFGVVENFDATWGWVSDHIREHHPTFEARPRRLNVTRKRTQSLEAELDQLRRDMGDHAFMGLRERNAADIELFEWASRRAQHAIATPDR